MNTKNSMIASKNWT